MKKDLNAAAAIPSIVDFAKLPKLAQAIQPIRCKHRFGGYHKDKKSGLYKNPLSDANKLIYDYPGDGQGLRFNPVNDGSKDFIYRELKIGYSEYDKDGFSYKLSGKTWKPYRFDDVVKFGKGKSVLMTEGEKDCEAIRTNVGLIAITFAGGMWSQEKIVEQLSMLKNAGLGLLIYWGDDDLTGIYKANAVRYGCASVGLPCIVLHVRKFFPQLPEWKPDKDGNLNGSGWGAADYFSHNKISPESFISILEDQVAEARNLPLEAISYPEKASSKKSKVVGNKNQSTKASIYGQLSPEELAARHDRIANGDYCLIDFISDKARSAVVSGSTPGNRWDDYPHLCFELWECYNYLLSIGIESSDKPESLYEEWIKNSGLCASDDSYDQAWICFAKSATKVASDKKKAYIQSLLNGGDDQGEKFELLPIAPRNLPLVQANPNAPHNRGTNSWSIFASGSGGGDDDPLILVYGRANGEKLSKHGYIVASIPDIKPTLKELKFGGFSYEAWEALKPLLMSSNNRYTHRPVYAVLNGRNINLEENLTRLLKLKKYHADLRIIEADNSIFDDIESFNVAYQNAVSYVEFKTSKLIRLDRKPDLLIPAHKQYFPSKLIDIPNKLGILSGFCGTGKTWQIEARVRENNRRGILTVVFSKTITLKDQAAVRLKIRTVEEVCSSLSGRIEPFSSCIDSVAKSCNLLKKHGYLDKNSPNYGRFEIIIDEVDETLCHYAIGNETHIAKIRALAVEAFSQLAINSHKLIICDANVSPIIVQYLEDLTRSKAYLVQHAKNAEGRKITIWDGKDPMEMFHLGLIKNLKKYPDQAFSVQTLSGDFQSKWIPKNLEELILQYIADRKISIADKGTIRDPKHENYNLLCDRTNGQSKLDLRMSELSRDNAIFLNNSIISTGTSIESQFEQDYIIAPAIGNPLGVFQKSLRIRYENKETHIWLGYANYTTYIYNSEDPNEIRDHLNKMDESVRLGFLSKGDSIADIPYNQLFEDLKCRLAARENFFNRNFKAATIALFKLWNFELIDKEDYLKSEISDQEIEDYRGNATAKRLEMSKIQQEEINQELLARCSAKVLTESEFEGISSKHEKRTLEEERQIVRTNFEREYEGAIECSVEEMRDYIDLKPQRLQNQFYFLNPELEHLRNVMVLEKSNFENIGKRDRADILRRLIRSSGYEKLRELGFDRFFYELYNIKGITPFNNIPKIQDGEYHWIKKVVTVSTTEGETFDQIHIDLSKNGNKNWHELCKMLVDLGAECRSLFGFTPGRTKFGIIKEFLSKFFISCQTNGKPGDSRSYYLRFDDNRDQYFSVLLNRHNQSIHSNGNPNYDLIHILGEGYGKPISTTGQIISEAYRDDRIDKESNLSEAIRQKRILGDKPKPLFANIEGKQLGFIIAKEAKEAREDKEAKKVDTTFERIEAVIGDYTFYNGKIAKVVGECQIGVGSLELEGFMLEDLRRRSEKAPKSKIYKANPIDIANHLNGKLAKYPEDREKLLKNVQLFLPDLLDSVLRLITVPV